MNKEWDLSVLYSGLEDDKYIQDVETLKKYYSELSALVSRCSEPLTVSYIEQLLLLMEKITELSSKLSIYVSLDQSVHTDDGKLMAEMNRLDRIISEGAKDWTASQKILGSVEDPEKFAGGNRTILDYQSLIRNCVLQKKHLMSNEEEALAAMMNSSGGNAWSSLQAFLTSTLKIDFRGETLTLPEIRDKAMSRDQEERREAYRAELAAYDRIKDSIAFSLNNIKNQVIALGRKRGFSTPLDESLNDSKMNRSTLEALLGAIQDALPQLRRFFKKKAQLLGDTNGLPWYDVMAPLGNNSKTYTAEQARDCLLNCFSPEVPEIAAVMKDAFEQSWIDFYPRNGKSGGAYDCGVSCIGQSRVMTNFTGSFDSVSTLAHELGHAFHDRQVEKERAMNQSYPMPIAETASTFNEIFLTEYMLSRADREEAMALLDADLTSALQCLVDIYSRFLFEKSVFEQCEDSFLMADDMCRLMTEAQQAAYGDGLDPEFRHPYMWLNKSHYYSPFFSFYNYPYAFGLLFATGLYAMFREDPEHFMPKYREMLRLTPVHTLEEDGEMMGVDLSDKAFWKKSIDIILNKVERFEQL